MYIYIYIYILSSSGADSMDSLDSLSPYVPINYHFRQFLISESNVQTEPMNVNFVEFLNAL